MRTRTLRLSRWGVKVRSYVNGEIIQEHGTVTDARPGKVVQEIEPPLRAERSP